MRCGERMGALTFDKKSPANLRDKIIFRILFQLVESWRGRLNHGALGALWPHSFGPRDVQGGELVLLAVDTVPSEAR